MNLNIIRYLVPLFMLLFLCAFLISKPAWLESIEYSFQDINYTLRGNRDAGQNIYLVYLDDDDLAALGEWPITRDYYSYLIHILKSSSARTIGLDILFAYPDKRHPEYDKTLADFLHSAGNVCLPMAFSQLDQSKTIAEGQNPLMPFDKIRNAAAAVGFSNFGKDTAGRFFPVKVLYRDSSAYSFGYQLARTYMGGKGISFNQDIILVNHFGKINSLQKISFLKLLHQFQSNPDSLNFENKLVFFSITAAGIATLARTPYEEFMPSSLLHLTVAENIINNTYLKELPLLFHILFMLLFLICLILIDSKSNKNGLLLFSGFLLILYWTVVFCSFVLFNTVIFFFLPALFLIFCSGFLYAQRQFADKRDQAGLHEILKKEINKKEEQLEALKIQLENESATAKDAQIRADEKNKAVLKLQKEINDLQIHTFQPAAESLKISDLVCSDNSPMTKVLDLVSKVSSDDIPVLVMGDTGTGKELIARIIHKKSMRSDKPFVAVNCGALPDNLLESELFGHEKGSFTGALAQRKGRFELAAGGTIFLDEITETSASFQVKLLRILQEGTYERLGSEKTLQTNARIIAASNKNIQHEIQKNNFRSDLFYRLNGFPITLPNLKERPGDIEILAIHFLQKHGYTIDISREAITTLKAYQWPGNVRELENIIRRAALLVSSENRRLIQDKDLSPEIKDMGSILQQNIYYSLEDQILELLRSFKFSHSSISQTAKILNNRDRGTITEYFRGLCFEYYVQAGFNISEAARQLAQSHDKEVHEKVAAKISMYLDNLKRSLSKKEVAYHGLPKKYHAFLDRIFDYM